MTASTKSNIGFQFVQNLVGIRHESKDFSDYPFIMLKMYKDTVIKKKIANTNAEYFSFFLSETNNFSPNKYGTSSAVTRRRIALNARNMLKSCRLNGRKLSKAN